MEKEKIFIFGASKAGMDAFHKLRIEYKVIGYLDNDQKKWGATINGVMIYNPQILKEYENIKIIICSMYYDEIAEQLIQMGKKNFCCKPIEVKISFHKKIKQFIYTYIIKKTCKSFGDNLKVNYKSHVNSQTILGNNVNFNGLTIRGGAKVIIGDNFHSGEDCLLITDIHNYDYGTEIPYDSTYIHKSIKIEDNVWLGSRVIILGGVTIGEGAIIQAGSVVTSNIPPYGIAGGHPAKVFKYRDIDHYKKLKSHGKFH